MTILLYCIGAVLLVLTGAVVSGGLQLPLRQPTGSAPPETPEDVLRRHLPALTASGRADDDHAV